MDAYLSDKITGALLGTAVGDALGMPVEGLSHQNVRTYYKGIKEYRADEKRGDLEAGQWTDDTQFTFALANAFTSAGGPEQWPEHVADAYVAMQDEARRWGPTTRAAVDRLASGADWQHSGDGGKATDGAAMRAAPLGAWWHVADASQDDALAVVRPVLEVTHAHPAAVAAGVGQAFAVRHALGHDVSSFDAEAFWSRLTDVTRWAEDTLEAEDHRVSERLKRLASELRSVPLDLRDLCDGAGVHADEAWPFAAAMFARAPHLIENTLLSTINVGGDADTTGAMVGTLLGALHGWSTFPDEWREGVEDHQRLEREARVFAEHLARLYA